MKKVKCLECNKSFTPKKSDLLQLCVSCKDYNAGEGSLPDA